jgi:hypothetical protein
MHYQPHELLELIIQSPGIALHLHDGESPIVETRSQSSLNRINEPPDMKPCTLLFKVEGPAFAKGDTEAILVYLLSKDAVAEVAHASFAAFEIKRDGTDLDVMAFREAGLLRLEIRRPGPARYLSFS